MSPAVSSVHPRSYNIRHNYGQEGKRTNYNAYACRRIISEQPSRGDHHGCPFKHQDSQSLELRLLQKRIPRVDVDKIIDLVKGHHYQVGCRCWVLAHGSTRSCYAVRLTPTSLSSLCLRSIFSPDPWTPAHP